MLKIWNLIKTNNLLSTNIFNVLMKSYIHPEKNRNVSAYVLDLPNWANVVPLTDDGKILLIKQFRFGTDKIELEIPGGIIEPNENPRAAALRELKEETGYSAAEIKQIGFVDANPAFMNNRCYTFLALLSEKGKVNFDLDEIIECEFATISQIKKYLKEGKITNAYCVLALMWYLFQTNFSP